MTSSFITKDPQVTLYRALNLRRLISLTGSGATYAFGFPHWQDLVVLFAEEADRQIKAILTTRPLPLSSGERAVERDLLHQAIGPLIDELHRLCGTSSPSISRNRKRTWPGCGWDRIVEGPIPEKMLAQVTRAAKKEAKDPVAQHLLRRGAEIGVHQAAPIDDHADVFLDLCKDYRTPREQVRRVLVESGLRKGAVSVTLGPDNIGEIVNFAAFSWRYE